MAGDQPTTQLATRPISRLFYVGPLALFVAACAYGVLEVHVSTDTWIGLAAGRQILTSEHFPVADTFSFTFAGEPWYNQNWLTHVFQYWLYSTFSPNAVVYATWTLAALVFVFALLACYWRSGTWLGATLAAAVVAWGCRDYLSARPATTGFFCIAALWALICALEGRRDKRRWWPIVLLPPLLMVWGGAHGSFVFGYGLLGLYVAHWLLMRAIAALRSRTVSLGIGGGQIVGVVVVVIVAAILTVALGPFGLENFTHGEKVAGSKIWRSVSEWLPPTVAGDYYPHVWRFWTILAGTLGLLAVGGAWRLATRGKLVEHKSSHGPHVSMFDLAAIAIGLTMTLWARRFVPLFLILSAPPVLVWIVQLFGRIGSPWRGRLLRATAVLAGVCAVGVGYAAASRARADLVAPFVDHPEYNLLERATRKDFTPREPIQFLQNNRLELNLLIEWSLAGDVMFDAPTVKVFIDGRAQQLYDEKIYQAYRALLTYGDTPRPAMLRILDRRGVDAVLLRRWKPAVNLRSALHGSPRWIPALLGPEYELFLRRDSRGLKQLGRLLRRGEEWRPEGSLARASRGFVWAYTTPPELDRALDCWVSGVRENIWLGTTYFPPITAAYVELGRADEARAFVDACERSIKEPFSRLPGDLRGRLLDTLASCRRYIEAHAEKP